MLWSASYAQSEYDTGYTDSGRYLRKQAACAAVGLLAMFCFSRIPAGIWYRLAWPIYGISIVLLLSVLVIGQEVNGARRLINIAGIQFQPSEVAKFAQILLFARLTRHFGEDAKTFRYGVLGFGVALLGILVPLALEK
ncbi:FtsW/RodA/SpoVE family cell cycle protein, partial [Vibrio sp. FNV 38]|nr:FtsW/RodA/SpoVE family cell cycle protein [Vibrio sp. FNV 38]